MTASLTIYLRCKAAPHCTYTFQMYMDLLVATFISPPSHGNKMDTK